MYNFLLQSKKEIQIKENDPGDSRSLYDLLDFIEGNDNINKDEKKSETNDLSLRCLFGSAEHSTLFIFCVSRADTPSTVEHECLSFT